MPGESQPSSPQSVLRVIRILEALASSPQPLGLAELARHLGTPKSSLAALLRGLAAAEIITAQEGIYALGAGAFGLGSLLVEARRHIQSSDLIRAGLRKLAAESGETALFAVRDDQGMTLTYVDMVESRNAVRFAVTVGDRRQLHCTAGGRILIASDGEEAVSRYLSQLKPTKLTPETETDKRRLAEILNTARDRGVAQTIDQAAEGVAGTASPIRDAHGDVLGALVLAAPTARARARLDELAEMVVRHARAISESLGFRPSDGQLAQSLSYTHPTSRNSDAS